MRSVLCVLARGEKARLLIFGHGHPRDALTLRQHQILQILLYVKLTCSLTPVEGDRALRLLGAFKLMADELELELSYEGDGGNEGEDFGEEVDYGVSDDEGPAGATEADVEGGEGDGEGRAGVRGGYNYARNK